MRWPFGPPHLTLKPSKKNKEQKNKKPIKRKEAKKRKQRTKKQRNYRNTKKELFSYQSNFSSFGVGVPNFPFLTTWPKKRAPKNTIKIGVSASPFSWKTFLSHETAIFGQKKPNPEIPVIIFFCLFSSLTTTKNTKIS